MSAANDSDVGQSAESSTDVGHGLVSCHLCLGLVAPDDLSRHYQCYHPGEASPPSRSSKLIAMVVTDKSGCHESNDAVTPAVPLPHQCSPRVAAAIDRDTIDEAVSANLELHRDYSKEAMVGLLRREFAGVPREYRALFVDIATSAARYVAGVEEISRTFLNTGYPADAERARRATRSLTSWRIGPRRSSIAKHIA